MTIRCLIAQKSAVLFLVHWCLLGPRYNRVRFVPSADTGLLVLSIIWNMNNIRGASYLYQIVAGGLRISRFAVQIAQSLSGVRY